MRLGELLAAAGLAEDDVLLEGGRRGRAALLLGIGGGPDVHDLVISSNEATEGALFGCVPGEHSDGHDYAAAAISRGAVALVCERPLAVKVPQVLVPAVRRSLGPLASALWSRPSSAVKVVGVTGTNGKTTTCSLVVSIFTAGGRRASMIGTLTGPRTTPEAPLLQRQLAGLRDAGTEAVAMEVSSHALVQHRTDGTEFAAAVFCNLSQDHLDYHGTMEEYFEAKAMLFTSGEVGVAVVNRADPWGARLAARLERVVTYDPAEAEEVAAAGRGLSFRWRGRRLLLGIPGRFNVANAVAAATVATELGMGLDAVEAGLAAAAPVRGRFELVDGGQPFGVVVDFAHTPAALEATLRAARELSSGRVLVVFGAGGDRDPGKRPVMGQVASELADVVIVTSDNPRSEDPLEIIRQVLTGASGNPVVEPDRGRAIEAALRLARDGDVVLIAGKGHETGQDFGTHLEPFDDCEFARGALRNLRGTSAEHPGHLVGGR